MRGNLKTGKINAGGKLRANLREVLCVQLENIDTCGNAVLRPSGLNREAIHDMRVAARRVRAVLKIFRAAFDRKELKRHMRSLTRLNRALGPVRDCDIIVENLRSMRQRAEGVDNDLIDTLIDRQREVRSERFRALQGVLRDLHGENALQALSDFLGASLA
jgi:CHAD domain-containing protein